MHTQPDHKEEFQDVFPLKHNHGLFTLSHKRKMSIHFKCQLFSLLYSRFYAAVHCNFSVVWGVRSKSDNGKNKTKRPLWSECTWINTSSKCFEQSSSSDLLLYSSSPSWREDEHWAKRAEGESAATAVRGNPVHISERVFSTAENPELSTLALWGGNEPLGQLYVDFA